MFLNENLFNSSRISKTNYFYLETEREGGRLRSGNATNVTLFFNYIWNLPFFIELNVFKFENLFHYLHRSWIWGIAKNFLHFWGVLAEFKPCSVICRYKSFRFGKKILLASIVQAPALANLWVVNGLHFVQVKKVIKLSLKMESNSWV